MSRGVETIVKCCFLGYPKNQISDNLGSSPAFPGIIFTHFGAQQRKANVPTGGCQAPAALLVLAALRCSFFLHLLSRVHYLFVVEL